MIKLITLGILSMSSNQAFLISDIFDETSIQRAEMFIQNCRDKIKDDDKLWIAFTANALRDDGCFESSFELLFQNLKDNLIKDGVFIKSLATNMRNTKEIYEVAKHAQTDEGEHGQTKVSSFIPNLESWDKSNVSSSQPMLIPYWRKNRKKHLRKAMKIALKKTKEDGPVLVLMFNPREIKINELKKVLIECGEDEKSVTLHPKRSLNQSTEELEAFLRNPFGTYIVPQESFTGMEAKNVLYFLAISGYATSIRCHLSRAISSLCIIHEIKGNLPKRHVMDCLFPSTEVNKSFLRCCTKIKISGCQCPNHNLPASNETANESKQGELQTCSRSPSVEKASYVCKPCLIICHHNHEGRTVRLLNSKRRAWICSSITIMLEKSESTTCSCSSISNCQLRRRN